MKISTLPRMFVPLALITAAAAVAQTEAPPVFKTTNAPAMTAPTPITAPAPATAPATGAASATAAAPAAGGATTNAAAPPSAPAQRSQKDLEALVAPIALYPDPVISSLLPASAYPLEIVQAARFVKDTNNISKLDAQPWDSNVKAVARLPEVITQMDNNIGWTSDLGDAFINQPKELMDAIQTMRVKAQEGGALKTTPQQIVTVTNMIVSNTVSEKTVYVTNSVVQIQPSQPDVIYVPQYNPTVVYASYPPYPAYYYPPPPPYGYAAASVVSFGVGMAVGAAIWGDCDWGHGGCYHSDVDIDIDRDVNRERNVNRNTDRASARANNTSGNRQKWQPDQNRLQNSGSKMSSTQSREARGWSSGQNRSTAATTRPSTGTSRAGSAGSVGSRPASSPGASRPSGSPSVNRPSSSPSVNRPSASPSANRPSASSASRPSSSQSFNRASTSSQRSAFSGGGGGASTRAASSRGAASRGGGGRGGGRR